jgi:two-component system, chemotaxis family, sensor kinase CheA
MIMPEADAELLQLFQDETTERLDDMDTALLAAEAGNVPPDTIDGLFRNAHTIKGAAGILGFSDIAALAHAAEDILAVARAQRALHPNLAAPLLRATAALRARVEGAAEPFDSLIAELNASRAALEAGSLGAGGAAGAGAGAGEGAGAGTGAGGGAGAGAEGAAEGAVPGGADADADAGMPAPGDGSAPGDGAQAGPGGAADAADPGPQPLATGGSWAARAGTGRPASLPQPRPAFGPGNGAPAVPATPAVPAGAAAPPPAAGQPAPAQQGVAAPQPASAEQPTSAQQPAPAQPAPAGAMPTDAAQPAAPLPGTAGQLPAPGQPMAPAARPQDAGRRSVRVPAEKIDHLLDLVGEVMQDRRRLAHALGAAEGLPTDAADELSAGERMLGELKDSAVGMRTLPVSMITGPLPRAVRDLARTIGREVEFAVVGAETELDRVILESLSEPLTHLLRNSVIHGIEPPEERERAGKRACGRIELRAEPRGGLVEITVSDDGRGVSPEIVEKARQEGSLADVLSRAGFSTAGEVTDLAGRGVGLDAVKAHVHSLGGRFEVSSEPGHGMAVSLLLPVALALLKVLLIQRGGAVYGLPIAGVEEVVTVDATTTLQGRVSLDLRGRSLPVIDLAAVIGADAPPLPPKPPALVLTAEGRWLAAACDGLLGEEEVVVKPLGPLLAGVSGYLGAAILGDGRIALLVEPGALIRDHRRTARGGLAAFHPQAQPAAAPRAAGHGQPAPASRAAAAATTVAPPAADAPAWPRATDGAGLLTAPDGAAAAGWPVAGQAPAAHAEPARILVVEDSFIVRELQRCVLESAGHNVVTASDGREALDALGKDEEIELVVTDMEMPRLGGLELTRAIRADERRSSLPVVMVTSRGSEEDRRLGMEAGVDAYIDKQGFQQSALLATIAQLLGR